jgi:GABA(A) receptor-associated protein
MEMFRTKYTEIERVTESAHILEKHPDRVPIIVEKKEKTELAELDKTKYLVPRDMTVGQFAYVIRKRIKLKSDKALFVFVDNSTLPPTSALISDVYRQHKYKDGFLYMTYAGENTFG